MDIGIKVANEIIGLHSQAAATGRALAQSTRQAEFYHEENARLKVSCRASRALLVQQDDGLVRCRMHCGTFVWASRAKGVAEAAAQYSSNVTVLITCCLHCDHGVECSCTG